MNREQQAEKFQEIYNRLNTQQRKAVDTIEGPVMVIAGPGTGKTEILSARIGRILLETDASPFNILCLTYTDAGVVAMRRRLLKFIGPDAYKVNIYTFHAFCNDVIQENLSLFRKTALDPVSELERIEYFTSLIDAFPKNHPLKRYRGDVYYEIKNLDSLFSTMKREGWTPAWINEKIDAYLADLENREEFVYKKAYKQFKAGDKKQNRIDEVNERMEKLRAAVNEFDRFQQIMAEKNRYDFDDMINWVIKAFEENKILLTRYQEQFLYILVDEYQDTSGTQNRLVQLLINYWEQPNIFVVGDDDQSIYRFQGANVENMLSFAQQYQADLLTVVLKDNYRSVQPILDLSRSLIDRNEERLVTKLEGLNKELVASHPLMQQLDHAPIIREYETQRQEMIGIVGEIESLLQSGTIPGEIAVIYKENRYGEEIARYCQLCGIPVFSKRSLNLFDQPLAKRIILMLRYLATEHEVPYSGDEMLFEILHFSWYRIPPIEIARMSVEVAERQFGANRISLRERLGEKAAAPPRDLFSQEIPGLKKAGDVLEELIGAVPNTTLQQLLERLVREGGVLEYIMQQDDKFWQLQLLTGFFDFVKEETARNPSLTLAQLVRILELMQKEGIRLPVVQVSGSEKGVNLLTVHGSKGLEFEYIFFAGCNASAWEKKRKPSGGYAFPDTIFSTLPQHREEEELRRLFYVALTRAKKYLLVSYARFRNDGKEVEPSMFIAELLDHPGNEVLKQAIDAEIQARFQVLEMQAIVAPEIAQAEEDFIAARLEKFTLNVTALNNYLNCPLEFYYRNLVRIPSPKNEATEFGSAIHFSLQRFFEKMQANNETFPPAQDMIGDFEWYLFRHRESFTREQFNRRLEYGQEVLLRYYENYIGSWNKVVAIERNIRNVVVDGVPLKGKIDKLEFNGKDVNVVDYKTGDIDKAQPKLMPPNDKIPNGGDYWRQAVFYHILISHYESKSWQVVSTEFDFVEPDKKKKYQKRKIVITPADVTTVRQQIVDTWRKIQDREFYTGCGKPDCHWCQFVKTNGLAVALHEIGDEEAENG